MAAAGPSWRRNAIVAVGCLLWITFLLGVYFGTEPEEEPSGTSVPPVVVEPVESYDSEDLARAADALEALRSLAETRLTPEEREAVNDAAEVVEDVVNGDATIAPAATTTSTTTVPTTTVPPTTTTEPPEEVSSVDELTDAILDQAAEVLP